MEKQYTIYKEMQQMLESLLEENGRFTQDSVKKFNHYFKKSNPGYLIEEEKEDKRYYLTGLDDQKYLFAVLAETKSDELITTKLTLMNVNGEHFDAIYTIDYSPKEEAIIDYSENLELLLEEEGLLGA